MRRKSALFVVLLMVAAIVAPMHAQNAGQFGRFPSDSGLAVFGYGTKTDTSAATMAADPGVGVYNYVYQASCLSTSATAAVAILKYSTTAIAAVPCVPSGGSSLPTVFLPPLKMPVHVALTMTASTSITTAYFYAVVRTSSR